MPPGLRWREWMLRVEAVIFAATEPVGRETLTRVVGKDRSAKGRTCSAQPDPQIFAGIAELGTPIQQPRLDVERQTHALTAHSLAQTYCGYIF